MTTKLTLTEYLDSKEKLRQAIRDDGTVKVQYSVVTYCKLPVGESRDEKELVRFKPTSTVLVEWQMNGSDERIPISVDNGLDRFPMYWSGPKFQKWLIKNTAEKF